MYGTIARMRAKPGVEAQLQALARQFDTIGVSGARSLFIYRMDNEPDTYYMAVVFENKEAYAANAASPEQDARFRQIRALLLEDPEWHDGELVHSS